MDVWTITIVGVGTVFLALVGLSLMLGMFKRLFHGRKDSAPSAATAEAPRPAPARAADGTLVAVISAAIAAATGGQPGSFRVVSVQASGGFSTPVWGHIDRLTRTGSGR
ncbi:MAG: OadG family protein [Spirochaetales bacterium]|nr:OadG family protein [Spirochaetales bacterium]